jgi:hypothetical protein
MMAERENCGFAGKLAAFVALNGGRDPSVAGLGQQQSGLCDRGYLVFKSLALSNAWKPRELRSQTALIPEKPPTDSPIEA